ncbi:hypothetical protein PILCRDRAFT_824716 [Piloderma croceum F 1598]|uniref:Uncharacterized protein n=1 Tax=Piloderma croceum (strain F 1598) TaxID=765440 RepID=A0A0C3BLP2_PILCF|nr:hypothetical protein PILCRDRAFT_824716 [Piloderma croceum F 1598]
MTETRRLLEAAAALSRLLNDRGVAHAFHGNVVTAVLANASHSDEIACICEGGPHHPFRRVREATEGSEDFTTTLSPWTNRLHTTYHRLIPSIEIEILPAGEEGPRRLDGTTTMIIRGIPFLTVSEFIRAKLRTWAIRGMERDAQDIVYVLTRYWNRVDANRIPEQDMNQFVARFQAAAPGWTAVKNKYGM